MAQDVTEGNLESGSASPSVAEASQTRDKLDVPQLPDPDIFSGTDKNGINPVANRFPFCIVWTPIPLLTWIFPFIGHMGICTSKGIIRDFAGPFFVGTNHMAFGKPTRYLILDQKKVVGGSSAWDGAVSEASDIYARRVHNLFCDNCHSHVATALDLMVYDNKENWNMFHLCFLVFCQGKFVGIRGFLKTFLPWLFTTLVILLLAILSAIYL